ncbi:hypothetical protein Vretifemale_12173, partial [Volvox reticuliferus]
LVVIHQSGQLLLQILAALLQRQLLLVPALLRGRLGAGLLLLEGVLADVLVDLHVQILQVTAADILLKEAGEVLRVLLRLLLLHLLHVLSHMTTIDILLHDLSIELLATAIVADEALLVVGNVQAAIQGTLQASKHLGASRGALQTSIQKAIKGARAILDGINVEVLAIGLLLTRVVLV